jgi:hypothetical protein
MTAHSQVEVQHFGGTFCLHLQGVTASQRIQKQEAIIKVQFYLLLAGCLPHLFFNPDDGGSIIL